MIKVIIKQNEIMYATLYLALNGEEWSISRVRCDYHIIKDDIINIYVDGEIIATFNTNPKIN